jgi:sugar lactone lactonase YvrE
VFAPSGARGTAGDLYVSSFNEQNVVRISPDGTVHLVVRDLVGPSGLAFDLKGILYVGQSNGTIVKVVNGVAIPFAAGLAMQSAFGLAFDKLGYLYVTETKSGVVTKIARDGTKTNFASSLSLPSGIAFDRQANLFVSLYGASVNEGLIYKYTSTGRTTFASKLSNPAGLAFDALGILYEADNASGTVFRFTPGGAKSFFASVSNVRFLAFDPSGNLFAADNIFTVSKITSDGAQTIFADINTPNGLAVEPPLSQSLNISTRVNVQTGDNALIGGFIVTGTGPKQLIVRAIGPSLSTYGLKGALQDTTLELRASDGTLIASNDNWKIDDQTQQSQEAAIRATRLPPTHERESALAVELMPGEFTAIVRGKNDTTGLGLVEIYDLDQTADSRLANISTRGVVGTLEKVMIGGFIIGGPSGAARLVIRAIGPSLANVGVTGALSDPTLSVRDSNGGEFVSNDDWRDRQIGEIQATGLAPTNDLESAIVATLPNGDYTVIVAGYNGGTGIGLVEVYNLN